MYIKVYKIDNRSEDIYILNNINLYFEYFFYYYVNKNVYLIITQLTFENLKQLNSSRYNNNNGTTQI